MQDIEGTRVCVSATKGGKQCVKGAGLKNKGNSGPTSRLLGAAGYGYGGGYGSEMNAATTTKTATKGNADSGAPARQIATKLSPVTEQYTNLHHTDLTPDP